ncbi:solute carrier family 43 member 3-like [Trematomus bernacchii]|uniref:solute carrier family 43 member 3-like n=1 Tax=Trematomus bernacchii TaxID=40690 RepID=UPI00146CAA7E|nr:solute carrier family 43 member 3-like [Trematomus bernacchii]
MFECQGGRVQLHYCLTVLSGLLESLFFTGITFGWASLVFVLKIDGYFAGYCTNTTRAEDQDVSIDCRGQDEHLSWVMSVATIANTLTRLPIGYVFDRCGTTVARLIAVCFYTTGTLLITLSRAETSVLLYPATACLVIAGTTLYITNVQVANLFDTYRSTIINVYNGAYDSSAAVFLIIKLLHEKGVSLHSCFFFLTLCSIFQLLRTFLLMPKGHIPYPLPDTYTYGFSCPSTRRERREEKENDKEDQELDVKRNKDDKTAEAETSALHLLKKPLVEPKQEEVSFRSCVMSWLFLWHLLWVVTSLLCQFLYLSLVNPMLTRLANNDQTLVSHYTNVFAITQLCAVLLSPLNGLIMDRHKHKPHKPLTQGETKREADLSSLPLSLSLNSVQCFLFCVCFTCPVLPLQYLTFILQVVNSAFFYAGHQAFISTAFPMQHFGKLSGLVMTLSSVVLFLQFPIQYVIKHQLQGDPLYVNVGLTVLSLLTFIHPVHVSLYCKKLAKQRKTKEANGHGSAKC